MGTIEDRWQQHIDKAFSGKKLSRRSLHAAIKNDGPEKFSIKLIDKATSLGELSELEVKHIEKHTSLAPTGYNLNKGGGRNAHYGQDNNC
jgi:hypothetical protein